MTRKKKNSGGNVALAVAAGAAVLLLGGAAFARSQDESGDELDLPGPKPWTPGPGGDGRVYGGQEGASPAQLPTDFDFGGNGLFIDTNCEFAIEGNLFWPTDTFEISAIEAENLQLTLAIEGNSIVGYIDYLISSAGLTDPESIAWTILEEASPMCTAVEPSQWGEGLAAWYDSFVARIVAYLDLFIGFGGDA